MKTTTTIAIFAGTVLLAGLDPNDACAQRAGGARGGRSAGFRSAGAGANVNRSPSMSPPGGGRGGVNRPGGAGGIQRPNAGAQGGMQRPNAGGPGGVQRPGAGAPGGLQRPSAGTPGGINRPNAGGAGGINRPNAGGAGGIERPNTGAPGGIQRPNAGGAGGVQRPNAGGAGGIERPNAGGIAGNQRPDAGTGGRGGPSSDSLHDFLGSNGPGSGRNDRLPQGTQRPGAGGPQAGGLQRPGAGTALDRPLGGVAAGGGINTGARTNIGAGAGARANIGVGGNNTNVNVGNVNVGNSVNYSNNRQAWVSQRQNWGNNVRTGVGGRYNNVFTNSFYRGGIVPGGYNYFGGWAARGPYYAWSPVTWASFGTFLGGAWPTAQPMYYGYGQGGNVYYENNSVYVNGQASGTPEQYYQQAQSLAAAAPPADQLNPQQQDWLPLGVFALTSEDTGDSQAVIQLAVNKQGVIAGTYYNEANQVNRPVQGSIDPQTQRAAIRFADNQNTDRVLETGINNLTQDEAPALLHFGAEQSQPVLLVRLKQPEGAPPTS
jgi:hypothetical protein